MYGHAYGYKMAASKRTQNATRITIMLATGHSSKQNIKANMLSYYYGIAWNTHCLFVIKTTELTILSNKQLVILFQSSTLQ